MIGQTKLKEALSDSIEYNLFPQFLILYGDDGCGRNMLVREVLREHGKTLYELPDVKVDTVRQMITDAYKTNAEVFYLIPDADSMSLAARNALLKTTEEPVHNAKIIMTLSTLANTLETILSRAHTCPLDMYTPEELREYYKTFPQYETSIDSTVLIACSTPGQIKQLVESDAEQMIGFTQKVIRNVAKVQGANAFKIGDSLNLKDDTKYDLAQFFRLFRALCFLDAELTTRQKLCGVVTTTKQLHWLQLGVNRQYVFDEWLLAIRKGWR